MGISLAWRRGDNLPTLQRLIELASELAHRRGSSDDYAATRSPARTGTDKRLAGGASGHVHAGS
jgi:hypothetical protein